MLRESGGRHHKPDPGGGSRRPRIALGERWTYAAALGFWAVLAALLAWLRVPFDDEWFSIDAAHLPYDALLRSLASDVHPPGPALLDHALIQAGAGQMGLHAPRLLASAIAVHLLARTLASQTKLPAALIVLACLHPVVIFYAGAVRWYPYVFLAQACRAWALWSGADPRARSGAFLVGALGPAAGYVDSIFLLHDCAWWIWLGRQRLPRPLVVPCLALLLAGAAVWTGSHLLGALPTRGALSLTPEHLLRWLAVGLLGHAHPPLPWSALAALLPVAVVLGWRRLAAGGASATTLSWIGLTSASWALAAALGLGIATPRYSLLVWAFAGMGIVALAARPGRARVIGFAAAAYASLVIGHALAGQGFVKGDLNDLGSSVCQALPDADLIVAEYPRLQELVSRQCDPSVPVLRLPHIRHEPDPAAILSPLRSRLAQPETEHVLHVYPSHRGGSTERAMRLVQGELRVHCHVAQETRLAPVPHWSIKSALTRGALPRRRFVATLWRCGTKDDRSTRRPAKRNHLALPGIPGSGT